MCVPTHKASLPHGAVGVGPKGGAAHCLRGRLLPALARPHPRPCRPFAPSPPPCAVLAASPLQYSPRTRHPRGGAALRWRLLRALGWAVVVVPYWEWNAAAAEQSAAAPAPSAEQLRLLAARLRGEAALEGRLPAGPAWGPRKRKRSRRRGAERGIHRCPGGVVQRGMRPRLCWAGRLTVGGQRYLQVFFAVSVVSKYCLLTSHLAARREKDSARGSPSRLERIRGLAPLDSYESGLA